VDSVIDQTYKDWEQIICSDGFSEALPSFIVESRKDPRLKYSFSTNHKEDHAFSLRREMLDKASGELIVFWDDDNYYCPTYLEKMVNKLENSQNNNPSSPMFAICQIIHFGPLPIKWGTPPKTLTGVPPILYNVDSSQLLIYKKALLSINWNRNTGYFFESVYEQLGNKYSYVVVDEILALHL